MLAPAARRARLLAGLIAVAGILGALGVLTGCRASDPPPTAGSPQLVWLAASAGSERVDTLVRADAATGAVVDSARLLAGRPGPLARDPSGRIWVGYIGGVGERDNRVQVFAPDGRLLATLTTPENPRAIAFSGGLAVIACARDGQVSALHFVDLATLTGTATVELPPPPGRQSHVLVAIGASESRIVTAAITDGPDPQLRHAVVTVLDAVSRQKLWQSAALPATDIWTILPRGDDFLLLNAASGESRDRPAPDVLVLHPDHSLTVLATDRAPVWGVVAGDRLVAFHDRTWDARSTAPERALTVHDLTAGTTRRFSLPDRFGARGLAVSGGEAYVAHGADADAARQGVYAIDTATGALRLLAGAPGVTRILAVR